MSKNTMLARVGAVYADGVSLIFDGQENPTEKHYKCNTSVTFRAGDRVKILKDSGTYIVEYVVGDPGTDAGSSGETSRSDLGSGNYTVRLTSDGFLIGLQNTTKLGANNYRWNGVYADGNIWLGTDNDSGKLSSLKLGGTTAKVGFFGKYPIEQPKVPITATVTDLIIALKDLGLIG